MDIRRIGPRDTITEDGIYWIGMNCYHSRANLCDGPSISSTGLKQILTCPIKYWAYSPYNPDRRELAPKSTFTFGKAAHSLCLEKRLPRNEFAVHSFANFNTNEGRAHDRHSTFREYGLRWDEAKAPKSGVSYSAYKKAWKEKAEGLGLAVLSGEDLRVIADMYQALQRDPRVQAGALDGIVEASLVWRDPDTGIWLKARPDVIPTDGIILNYKTCEDASLDKISRQVETLDYYISESLIVEGLGRVLGQSVTNAGFLNQEKTYPHVTSVYELSDEYIACGLNLIRHGVSKFRECLDKDDWPGYAEDNSTLVPSNRVKRRAFGTDRPDIGSLDDVLREVA